MKFRRLSLVMCTLHPVIVKNQGKKACLAEAKAAVEDATGDEDFDQDAALKVLIRVDRFSTLLFRTCIVPY